MGEVVEMRGKGDDDSSKKEQVQEVTDPKVLALLGTGRALQERRKKGSGS